MSEALCQNEAVVIAVLNRSGLTPTSEHLFSRGQLQDVMARAAKEFMGIFAPFEPHRIHNYSKVLRDVEVVLMSGGAISWVGSNFRIRVSFWLAGPAGRMQYARFAQELQQQIDQVALWFHEEVAKSQPVA